jgi:hypothetical protein
MRIASKYFHHIMDEPRPKEDFVAEYAARRVIITKHMPGIPTINACGYEQYSDYIDVFVAKPKVIAYHDKRFMEQRRKQGKRIWHYQCCSPNPPFPNRWIDRSLACSRLYPWLGYLFDTEGYLFWATNQYRGANPYTSSIGPVPGGSQAPGHPVGDNWTYYPGSEGIKPSMRMVAFRDGMLDHTLLKMLSQKDKVKADEIMKKIARWTSGGTKDYSEDPATYHKMRRELLNALD